MKKILIATLVGGIILFAWNSISWMVLPIHLHTFKHTPAQDSILNTLKNSGLEDGIYFLPSVDNSDVKAFDSEYQKKCEEFMQTRIGQPIATIHYTGSMPDMTPTPILKGFLYSLIAVFCVSMLLSLAYQNNASYFMRWWMVMLFAITYIMTGPLMGMNWMGDPWHYASGFIYDALIGWGLTGLWLAKYLKRS